MITRTLTSALLALIATSPATAREPGDVLQNGSFEAQGSSWLEIYPRGIQNPAPDFDYPREDAHDGKRCARLTTKEPGGFSSLTQKC
ncbi:MAG: hypothetical protein GY711_05440 [bacterium]|nr:hypothetical protein [bacterium]